ncbi:hypothetical protein [Streptococcus raffinosi]|uniref:CopG family transcriptional regulator n=1 Tax=Streptococcus raffinosi TaxID=3053355 RepID=A0ABT7LQJ1_9STRE|nr:hypothetical protein [Streptococcus sp. VTCC 12812]MDL5042917.1 hypothetical protein [Streptococcus sp. VTCC 12812]
MAQINIKLTDDQKQQISDIAKERGISITQLVISSILVKEKFYTDKDGIESIEEGIDRKEKDKEVGVENNKEDKENSVEEIIYKEYCETLKEQIIQKDKQIDQLHQIIYNKDTLLIETSIEDIENDAIHKHWWQFWK